MASAPLNLGHPGVLAALDASLLSQPYVNGFAPSQDDVVVFQGMGPMIATAGLVPTLTAAPSSELPNLKRWWWHVHALASKSFPGIACGNTLPAGEAEMDALFAKQSYLTKAEPSFDDFAAYNAMPADPSAAAPNAARWFRHIGALVAERFHGPCSGVTVVAAGAVAAAPAYTVDWPMMDKAKANGCESKKIKAANKEGGKKGVEIEGAADMGGLEYFCTRMPAAEGNVDLLDVAMEGMNAVPDPDNAEERKGCSGRIGKLIISENEGKKCVAMVAYVPEAQRGKVSALEWMQSVCDTDMGGGVGGTVMAGSNEMYARCLAVEDPDKGFFYLKMKDSTLSAAIMFLRKKGLFTDEEEEEEGDNPAGDFEW